MNGRKTSPVVLAVVVAGVVLVGLIVAAIGVAAVVQLGEEASVAEGDTTKGVMEDCATFESIRAGTVDPGRVEPELRSAILFIELLRSSDSPGSSERVIGAATPSDLDSGLASLAQAATACADTDAVLGISLAALIAPLLREPAVPSYCAALETAAAGGSSIRDETVRNSLMAVAPTTHRDAISRLEAPTMESALSDADAVTMRAIAIYAEGSCGVAGASDTILDDAMFAPIGDSI